jgi:hypothetical protein
MWLCRSCGNDAINVTSHGVGNVQEALGYHADDIEPHFVAVVFLVDLKEKWIGEHLDRSIERYVVLDDVPCGFVEVPFKFQGCPVADARQSHQRKAASRQLQSEFPVDPVETSAPAMVRPSRTSAKPALIWEGHKAGRHKGYCQIEKMANLDQLPSSGFTVSCLPVKIHKASGGWTRAVAIISA